MTTTGRRVLGVDLGSRRIGLAATDPSGALASPHSTLARVADPADDHRAIVAVARELGADRIVVGLPRSLSGELGPSAQAVQVEVDALAELARADAITVVTYDERFTTMIAQQGIRASKVRRGARRRAQRDDVDAAAAAVILQSWVDARA